MASIIGSIQSAAASVVGTNEKLQQLQKDTVDHTTDEPLRSYYGVPQAETEHSLTAGVRGPALLEDAHAREKISRFDHERIPERVVHARGAGAHGYFTLYTPIPEHTSAPLFTDSSRKTPMFVRFSTVQGSRGSGDSVRDLRGFAARFYTPEGNFDIVGNDVPVFFIQDAIKFPDLVHAVKPEPHNEIPQGQTAHDNAWDFFSLTPESAHTVIWAMSDRGIPRSFRHMQGFGVHSFVFANASGERSFVKFHWRPQLGTHGLAWDEALKLAGQDPDYHRRDLYDAIAAGAYPKWDLGVQVVPEKNEHDFEFDLLDATKIIPEEVVPVEYIGTLTLNKSPDEFFPETEQVAFCTQHMIPGIEHSNDPLLAGRSFSYFDTQLTRLGGPNFSDIPINRPVCPFAANYSRDGFGARQIHKGPNYWPNRFDKSTHPVPPHQNGYLATEAPIPAAATKVRRKGEKFNEHFHQATLYWNSLSPIEQEHVISAYSFELGKVDDTGVHQRSVDYINNVDNKLACAVAESLSIAPPKEVRPNHGQRSEYLSLQSKHNTFTASGRKIGIYVLDGFDPAVVLKLQAEVTAIGSIPLVVGPRAGKIKSSTTGISVTAQFTFETSRSTYFDAIVFAGGSEPEYAERLSKNGRLVHAAREAFMHYKAIGAVGVTVAWLRTVALPGHLNAGSAGEAVDSSTAPGVVITSQNDSGVGSLFTERFLAEVAKHRAWERDVSGIAA